MRNRLKQSATWRYALYGALFGFLFPIGSTLGDLWLHGLPLTPAGLLQIQLSTPLHWVIDTAPFFLGAFASFAGRRQDALARLNEQLDRRVAEHRALLERRTAQLRVSTEVGRAASSILDPDELARQVVNLISDRFGFYYAAIFVLDEAGEWAVLREATGRAGLELKARGHRLQVGGQSMVGTAISMRQARIALDVGGEPVRFDNPLLPETHSEIALPLIVGDRVLGALDVQTTHTAAFDEQDIATLQGLANQVAVALENARFFREAQTSLKELRRLHQTYLREAWNEAVADLQSNAVRYTADGVRPVSSVPVPGLDSAVRERKLALSRQEDESSVTAPIILRDQVIGALNLKVDDRPWTEDELAIIEAVTNQAALAMENARLIQESQAALAEAQRLALRERQLNRIVARIRQSTDVETILSTTLLELGRTLGVRSGQVRLTTSAESHAPVGPDGQSGNRSRREGGPR